MGDLWCTTVGDDAHDGLSPATPKRTLATVMNLLSAGDTVYIDAGNYSGQAIIDTDYVSLIGAGSTMTLIDVGDTTGIPEPAGVGAIGRTGLMVKDMLIRNGSNGIFWQRVSNSTIESVTVTECRNGITFTECVNNRIHNVHGYSVWQSGIFFQYQCTNIRITESIFESCYYGMLLDGATDCLISNNLCRNSNAQGIAVYRSNNSVIRDNICSGNGYDGIFADNVSELVVESNQCVANIDGISFNTASNVLVRNNVCNYNRRYGIHLAGTTNSMVEQNTLYGNAAEGIGIRNVSISDTFSKNNFYSGTLGNRGFGSDATSETVLCYRNYWYTTNAESIASRISGVADITWQPYRLGMVDTAPGADTIAPQAPDWLVATWRAPSCSVAWSSAYTNEEIGGGLADLAGYNLYRSTEPAPRDWGRPLVTIMAPLTGYNDYDVVVGETYYYRITAFDDHQPWENESWYSDSIVSVRLTLPTASVTLSVPMLIPGPINPAAGETAIFGNSVAPGGDTVLGCTLTLAGSVPVEDFDHVNLWLDANRSGRYEPGSDSFLAALRPVGAGRWTTGALAFPLEVGGDSFVVTVDLADTADPMGEMRSVLEAGQLLLAANGAAPSAALTLPGTWTIAAGIAPPWIAPPVPAESRPEDAAPWIVPLTAYEHDTNSRQLAWSVTGGGLLVTAAVIEGDTLVVTPIANAFGAETLTIFLTDGFDTVTQPLPITLLPVNDPPAITPPVVAAAALEDGDTWYLPLGPHAVDVDGDPLGWSVSGGGDIVRGWLIAGETLALVPLPDAFGTDTLTLALTDGAETVVQLLPVKIIAVNDPPLITPAVPPQEQEEDTPAWRLALTDCESDRDGPALRWTVSGGGTLVVVSVEGGDTLVITPVADACGTETVALALGDGADTVSQLLPITLIPGNDPPVFVAAVPTVRLWEDGETAVLDLRSFGRDADGDPLAWSVSGGDSAVVAAVAGGETLLVAPRPGAVGDDTLLLALSDGQETVTQFLPVIVIEINDTPVIAPAIEDDTRTEDTLPWQIVLTDHESDSNGNALDWSVAGGGVVVTATVIGGDTLVIAPVADANGTETLTLFLTDGFDTVSQSLLIILLPVNDTPVIAPAIPSFTRVDDWSAWEVSLLPHGRDLDGDPLAWSVAGGGTVVTATMAAPATLRLAPIAGAVGTEELTLALTDGLETVTQTVSVTLDRTPEEPFDPNLAITVTYGLGGSDTPASVTPIFRWDAFPGATRYRVVIKTGMNQPLIMDRTVAAVSLATAAGNYTQPLRWGTTYYWWYRPDNGGWIGPNTFTPTKKVAPTPLAPWAGNGTDSPATLTPTFAWDISSITGASSNRLIVRAALTGPILCDRTIRSTSVTPTAGDYAAPLQWRKTYYWWAATDNSRWAGPFAFIPTPPAPVPLAPDAGTAPGPLPTFRWQGFAGDGNTFTLALRASLPRGTLLLLRTGIRGTSYAPGANEYTARLVPGTTYYWTVKSAVTGAWSPYTAFTVAASATAAADAVEPAVTILEVAEGAPAVATMAVPDGTEWQVALDGVATGSVLVAQVPDATERALVAAADLGGIGNYAAGSSAIVKLTLLDGEGTDRSEDTGIVRTLSIGWDKLAVADPATLGIFWFDPAENAWREVTGVPDLVVPWPDGSTGYHYDATTKTVSIRVAHFSIYGIFPRPAPLPLANVADVAAIVVYPNPFVPNDGNDANGRAYDGSAGSGIIFQVPNETIEVKIYTLTGQLVDQETIIPGAGTAAGWDVRNRSGSEVASGIYFIVFKGSSGTKVVKQVIIR